MLKRMAGTPLLKKMEFTFTCELTINSHVEDTKLPEYIQQQLAVMFADKQTRVAVKRVIRNGEGIIEDIYLVFNKAV